MIQKNLAKIGLNTALGYISKNPEKNMEKLMDWVDLIAGTGENSYPVQRAVFRNIIKNPDSNWYQLLMRVFRETDTEVLKSFFTNFMLNANIIGWPVQQECREKYNCNIPWAILLDPTSACNLHCKGCWAAEYGNKLNLSLEEIDDIIKQGKELGIYMYIYTGGEPLVRKKDLIKICEMHPDCSFLSFTNGTLIDDEFAEEMLRVKNFVPAISIEGGRETTDSRRGEGTYDKVIRAMKILKAHRLPFGASCCYTSVNCHSIASEEFFDQLIDWGASFVWYFHYMPVGNDALPELMPSPEQREFMYRQIRHFRQTKAIFSMDFQNDAEYVQGCIAGGRRYLHINSNGDVDPCVFIHYSDSNIREKTLLQCLQSPLFMAYHDGQPFNGNHLRPCPMLENPEKLPGMVNDTEAKSTDMLSPESAEHLCAKCTHYAECWKPTADRLWNESKNLKEAN